MKKQAQFFYKDANAPKPNQPNSIGTSVLIVYEDKLLLEHRRDSDNWAIIGGKLEADEDLVSGAVREVFEETGLLFAKKDLKLYKIYDDPSRIASYPDGNVLRIITVVYYIKLERLPELVCSEESRELRFFTAQELRKVQLARTHIPILEDYLKEVKEKEVCRCRWCNPQNPIYIEYHDHEWCVPEYRDELLFELLILESFQAGLSWECVLNKREYFRQAFDGFELEKVCDYDEDKVAKLLQNKNIIRNRRKVDAAINNARIFRDIQKEYGSFAKYIWAFTNDTVIYEVDRTSSELSDRVSADLKKRGMRFVGTTIIYSYLQAIGVIYSHDKECFLFKGNK